MIKKTYRLDRDTALRLDEEAEMLGIKASEVARRRLRQSYQQYPTLLSMAEAREPNDVWKRVVESEEARRLFMLMLVGARARQIRLAGEIGDTDQDEATTYNVLKGALEDHFARAGYSEL